MPALPWWGYLLVKLAITFGIPQVVKWFPNIPQWLLSLIEDVLNGFKDPDQDNKEVKKRGIAELKKQCKGTICPPETKND